jgi:hypothetical protein
LEKVRAYKTMLQQGHCQPQPIKARPWSFTLKDRTLNFSCVVDRLVDATAMIHESPKKFFIATNTQTTIASRQISASMTYSSPLTSPWNVKYPMVAIDNRASQRSF